MRSKVSETFWRVGALFIIGFVVRLYHLGVPSFWYDEIKTAIRIDHPLWETIGLLGRSEFPPLHYVILNLWVGIWGNSEWALRFPSMIFSSLSVIVIYKLGKELFNKETGLIAASLLVFSPYALNYAQDAKMYALFWFLSSVSFLYFFRIVKGDKRNVNAFYIFATTLCCYTMFTGFLLLTAQSLIFLIFADKTRRRKWFIGQLIVFLFCLPWIIHFLSSRHDFGLEGEQYRAGNYIDLLLRALPSFAGGVFGATGKINCFLFVFLIVYAFSDGIFVTCKSRGPVCASHKSSYFLFYWTVVPLLIYFAFDYFIFPSSLHTRHIGFLHIPLLLVISGQISKFNKPFKSILVAVLITIACAHVHLYFRDNLKYPGEDWRGAIKGLSEKAGNDSVIWSQYTIDFLKYYYKGDMGRVFIMGEGVLELAFSAGKNVMSRGINSIFIIYRKNDVLGIDLDDFQLEGREDIGMFVLAHYRRNKSSVYADASVNLDNTTSANRNIFIWKLEGDVLKVAMRYYFEDGEMFDGECQRSFEFCTGTLFKKDGSAKKVKKMVLHWPESPMPQDISSAQRYIIE